MKKISFAIYILLVAVTLGCSKNSDDVPEQEATKFPPPTWKEDDTGKYPATMTAVFALPAALAGSSTANDKLASFINEECRGVGTIVEANNLKLFFVLIQGLPEETNNITIKYYCNKTSYMYQSQSALTFLADGVSGTAENPKILELTQLK